MSLAAAARDRWHRARGHDRLHSTQSFLEPLRDGAVLEIGGPSAEFRATGRVPVYGACRSIDGVQYAAETFWHGRREEGEYMPEGRPTGSLYIRDATDLIGLPDASWDAVITSHVLEHIANPLRALAEWRRVLRPTGLVLTVAPHKEGTFDHRRPVTPLEHMVGDLEAGTGEDDLTHVAETLRLHDRARDVDATDPQRFEQLRRANQEHRLLHHHVFTTRSLLALLDHAGHELLAVEACWPHDIFVLSRPGGDTSGNPALLRSPVPRSPFRLDR